MYQVRNCLSLISKDEEIKAESCSWKEGHKSTRDGRIGRKKKVILYAGKCTVGSVDIWRGNYCSTDETTCSPAYTTRLLPSFWRVMLFLCVVDGGVQFRPK